MNPPQISVVIPAWNATSTLSRAISSVRAQDYDSTVEIVVVNDASDDGTAALASELGARVVTLPDNRGPALALKAGLEASSNAWVAFIDADDEWLPGKLRAQAAALSAMPDAAVIATAFIRIDRDGRRVWTYGDKPFRHSEQDFWKTLLAEAAILKSSALVRRDAALATGALDRAERVGEDQLLFQALAETGPVAYVPEPLVLYHDNASSLTNQVTAHGVQAALDGNLAAIARVAPRLTYPERRALVARRWGEAADGFVAARTWPQALAATARAIAGGDAPGRHLWRLLTNLPPVRRLKALLPRA